MADLGPARQNRRHSALALSRRDFATALPGFATDDLSARTAAARVQAATRPQRSTTAISAVRQSPRPAATPTADTTQIDAAVVRPSTRRSDSRRRITPPPMKPTPATMPWMIRLGAAKIRTGRWQHQERAHQCEERRTEGDQRMGSRPRGLLDQLAIEADHSAKDRRERQPAGENEELRGGADRIHRASIAGVALHVPGDYVPGAECRGSSAAT